MQFNIPEGNITQTVYTLIRDGKFSEAIRTLSYFLHSFPKDRGALSLLGFCQYQVEDYAAAAPMSASILLVYFFIDNTVTNNSLGFSPSLTSTRLTTLSVSGRLASTKKQRRHARPTTTHSFHMRSAFLCRGPPGKDELNKDILVVPSHRPFPSPCPSPLPPMPL